MARDSFASESAAEQPSQELKAPPVYSLQENNQKEKPQNAERDSKPNSFRCTPTGAVVDANLKEQTKNSRGLNTEYARGMSHYWTGEFQRRSISENNFDSSAEFSNEFTHPLRPGIRGALQHTPKQVSMPILGRSDDDVEDDRKLPPTLEEPSPSNASLSDDANRNPGARGQATKKHAISEKIEKTVLSEKNHPQTSATVRATEDHNLAADETRKSRDREFLDRQKGNRTAREHRLRPGAYAHPGPGSLASAERRERRLDESVTSPLHLDDSEGTNPLTDDVDVSRNSSEPNAMGSSSFLVRASKVDDAETIIEAHDVQHDQFKRRLQMGILGIIFLAIAVLGVFLLTQNEDEPACIGDEICCFPTEEQNVLVRCACGNSTLMRLDELSDRALSVYELQLQAARFLPIWAEYGTDDWDRNSCNPLNQGLVRVAELDGYGLTDQQLLEIPYNIITSYIVLTLFYITMDGVRWEQSEMWVDDAEPCSWFGVGCLFISYWHEMRLPNNGLSGTLPEFLFSSPTLREIDLSANNISGTIPTALTSMTRLSALYLGDLQLTGTIPSQFGELDRLGVLDLHQNELTGTIPSSLFQLPTLRELELASNELAGTLPNSIIVGGQMTTLRLNNNRITGTLPTSIANLTNLELLNIGINDLSGTIPEFLGWMDRLELINLYQSGLTGTIPDSFCQNTGKSGTTHILVNCSETTICRCCSTTMTPFLRVYLECGERIPDIAQGKDY